MAEQQSSTALVPTLSGEYQMEVKEFGAAGASTKFMIPVPNNVDAQTASLMLRAGVLKNTTWKDKAFPIILHAVIYSDRMGLDIMAGDVYMAQEGRLSTTSGAKIRHAMNSGRIVGYQVEITNGPVVNLGKYNGPDLRAKVTVHVKDWTVPMIYETTLKEWYMDRNPNWNSRPAYMLRRNALSKALEEVAPMGIEADEAEPLPSPSTTTSTITIPAAH